MMVVNLLLLGFFSALAGAQQLMNGAAEQRIETTTPMVFSNHNVNLNNVGLQDEEPEDIGPKLEGPYSSSTSLWSNEVRDEDNNC